MMNQELANLPNGMTCYKEHEAEALRIYDEAYSKTFDGFNYDIANAIADNALYQFLTN